MRLIHNKTLKFQEFSDESNTPPYAILSHTWVPGEEVSLQDMSSPYLCPKAGYAKITETCRLSLAQGLEYSWVDTCCIDKTSSAELTEAINSMFRWYEKAQVCYVYLADLHAASMPIAGELKKCHWFSRDWTLQELLAPGEIQFYNSRWACLGTKSQYDECLADATGIPSAAIRKACALRSFPVAERMSWASNRVTTRKEDVAYCLLGLFGVHMPLIYGEGEKAFLRLQEAIVRETKDKTILAWTPEAAWPPYCPILAPSPKVFKNSLRVSTFPLDDFEYSFTNQGLTMTGQLVCEYKQDASGTMVPRHVLILGTSEVPVPGRGRSEGQAVGIYLKQFGPGLFVRQVDSGYLCLRQSDTFHISSGVQTFQLMIKIDSGNSPTAFHPYHAPPTLSIPACKEWLLDCAFPTNYWDQTRRVCYYPISEGSEDVFAFAFTSMRLSYKLAFAVLLDWRASVGLSKFHERLGTSTPFHIPPHCHVLDKSSIVSQQILLSCAGSRNFATKWYDLETIFPELRQTPSSIRLTAENKSVEVSVWIEPDDVRGTIALRIDTKELPG